MAQKSDIEWTDATWNPTVGCSIISPGCKNCYAMKTAARLENISIKHEATHGGDPGPLYAYQGTTEHTTRAGPVWTGKVRVNSRTLTRPLSWPKPRRIFVNSMSDLFHPLIPIGAVDTIFAVMALCEQHDFQVLTKRSENMLLYLTDPGTPGRIHDAMGSEMLQGFGTPLPTWPLRNVWMGVSVENASTRGRIRDLRNAPAAVRFISAEPLLEDLDKPDLTGIDWLIAGGESGPKKRPVELEWIRNLRDECAAQGVAFFMKQVDKKQPIPEDLMIRQMPKVAA